MREARCIAKSINKPIVDIGPSQYCLNRLQHEDEISCSKFASTSKCFRRVISNTNLETLWVVCHLENCSCIHLNVCE